MIIIALVASITDYPTPLRPLVPLVSHCWSTRLSQNTVDRHCFRAIYGGKHIEDEHIVTVDGKSVYWGNTMYSAEALTLTFTYVNSLGGVGRGSVAGVGNELIFSLNMRATPAATPEVIQSKWRITTGGYSVTSADAVRRFQLDDR